MRDIDLWYYLIISSQLAQAVEVGDIIWLIRIMKSSQYPKYMGEKKHIRPKKPRLVSEIEKF